MSTINPRIRAQFESLSIDLKNEILSRNVVLNTMQDLISVLETIVNEESSNAKTATNNQWVSTGISRNDDTGDRRDGPGGENADWANQQ